MVFRRHIPVSRHERPHQLPHALFQSPAHVYRPCRSRGTTRRDSPRLLCPRSAVPRQTRDDRRRLDFDHQDFPPYTPDPAASFGCDRSWPMRITPRQELATSQHNPSHCNSINRLSTRRHSLLQTSHLAWPMNETFLEVIKTAMVSRRLPSPHFRRPLFSYRSILLLGVTIGCLNNANIPHLWNSEAIPTVAQLTRDGPFLVTRVTGPRLYQRGYAFDKPASAAHYFVPDSSLPVNSNLISDAIASSRAPATAYLWLFFDNQRITVWRIEVSGSEALSYQHALLVHAARAAAESRYAIASLFLSILTACSLFTCRTISPKD